MCKKDEMKNKCFNCENDNNVDAKYCSFCGYKLEVLKDELVCNETKEDLKKENKPKKRFNVKFFFAFIISFLFTFYFSNNFFYPSIDKKIALLADEINKTCPISVDQFTTLKNVVPLPNKTLQYNYILVGITKAEVKMDTVKKYIFPNILENIKTNPQMEEFRKNNINFNYHYVDKNGVFVTDYKVTPEMYN